jgi:two-component system LytT family response regulator
MPIVIFLTAFEAAALDYLLKPFDEERLQKAVARTKAQIQIPPLTSPEQPPEETGEFFKDGAGFLKRVLVKKGGRVYFFKTTEIEWIEAYGNYVRLHFEKTTYLLRETISSLETQLDPKKFARPPFRLVNLERIDQLQPVFGGRAKIILASGAEIIVSRRYYRKLSKLFEKS